MRHLSYDSQRERNDMGWRPTRQRETEDEQPGGQGGGMGGYNGPSTLEDEESYGGGAVGGWGTHMASGHGLGGQAMERGPHSGRGPRGYRRSDERIHEEINHALTLHGKIDPSDVLIEVVQGEVTISGTVDDRETKRACEDVAEGCHDVRQVRNTLRVRRR